MSQTSKMSVVVISPEDEDAREITVMEGLFADGLEQYHVRKPYWPLARMERWLYALSREWWPKLILHQHHELVHALKLGGCHWKDDGTAPPVPLKNNGFSCRACHKRDDLLSALGHYDAVMVSPVFPSISKPGHNPNGEFSPASLSERLQQRTAQERRTAIIALGGITASTAPRCRDCGFDGVAVLGAIWETRDPLKAFEEIQKSLTNHAA